MNLSPKVVTCDSSARLKTVALELRNFCVERPDTHEGGYAASKSVGEAVKTVSGLPLEFLEEIVRYSRLLVYKGTHTNVMLTLLDNSDGRVWNFSISHPSPAGPQKVADDLAAELAEVFLGEGYTEVPPKAVWTTIRHYVRPYTHT